MRILGIETSCDETAAAVVQGGKVVLSNVVVSSLSEHQKFGGIIPELASRRQLDFINDVVAKSLTDAHLKLSDIDAVAVTITPGLLGSLLVGTCFARALSFSTHKPLMEVDHIQAHLYANFLIDSSGNKKPPALPAIGLVVSGGHTSLYLIRNFRHIKLLGQTLDDAAGEAFDKVAKILNLGYPGGPAIDKLAKEAKRTKLTFPCADLGNSLNFSFSGIKTSVLYYVKKHQTLKNFSTKEVAYAFQKSVVDTLIKKCLEACQKYSIKTLLIGGGVAANSTLRSELLKKASLKKIKVYFPALKLCLDNAAMIAGLAYHHRHQN